MILTVILAVLALLSLALNLWQWLAAAGFPLHRRLPAPQATPGVTLFKPLKGCDAQTAECLRSWFQQDYKGPVQLLFGVASATDPVCDLVRKLMKEHPGREASLVICEAPRGFNAKVSTLVHLQEHARQPVFVVSDADVYAPPDWLSNMAAILGQSKTGLVCSFYRMANQESMGMQWEAVAVNADFWSSVLMAKCLSPIRFALGAVMAAPKEQIEAIGGFAALGDYLADDYQLGNKVAATGGRVQISPVVVECRSDTMTWSEVWNHQLRWSRTIRVCQPAPYFFSILNNATLWPLLWLAASPTNVTAGAVAGCLALRMGMAWFCERKLAGNAATGSWKMAILKDLLHCLIWALSFIGNHITWRGRQFRVGPGGKLEPS